MSNNKKDKKIGSKKKDSSDISEINNSFSQLENDLKNIDSKEDFKQEDIIDIENIKYLEEIENLDEKEEIRENIDVKKEKIKNESILDKLNKLNKEKDINTKNELIKKLVFDIENREEILRQKEKVYEANIRDLRKEEEELRGKSKIDKILILIDRIKNSIISVNHLEKGLIEDGIKINELSLLKRKIIRTEGEYEFYVEDAKKCQKYINDILKYLNTIKQRYEDGKNKLSYLQNKAFYMARGISKVFHYRFNFFDNHFHMMKQKPIEILRLFSALEASITTLSSLDLDVLNEKNETLQKSFDELSLDDKMDFMHVNFIHDYIEGLNKNVKSNCLVRLLETNILSPESVLEQMTKWDQNNPPLRKKFIEYLSTYLTETERLIIAEKDIKTLESKGMILKSS